MTTGFCEITKEIGFDAGHRVPNHESKCRNPHGHRYRLITCIEGRINDTPGSPEEGMLKDFGFLKALMMEKVHDVLDHGFIVFRDDDDMMSALHHGDFTWNVIEFPYIPTAENIARWAFEKLVTEVNIQGYRLSYVEVWETPTSMAKYMGANHAATE